MVASEALQKGLGCFGLFATLNKERGDVLFMEMPPTPGVQTAPQATVALGSAVRVETCRMDADLHAGTQMFLSLWEWLCGTGIQQCLVSSSSRALGLWGWFWTNLLGSPW